MHKKADFDQVYKFSLLSRAPASMSRNHHATHSKTGKKTVMICDDERDLLQLFRPIICNNKVGLNTSLYHRLYH